MFEQCYSVFKLRVEGPGAESSQIIADVTLREHWSVTTLSLKAVSSSSTIVHKAHASAAESREHGKIMHSLCYVVARHTFDYVTGSRIHWCQFKTPVQDNNRSWGILKQSTSKNQLSRRKSAWQNLISLIALNVQAAQPLR